MKTFEFFDILKANGYEKDMSAGYEIWFNKQNGIWTQSMNKGKDIAFCRIPDMNKPYNCELLWSVGYTSIEGLKFENGCFIFGDRTTFKV